MRTRLNAARRLQLERLSRPLSRYEGLALILFGIGLIVLSTTRFVRTEQLLDDEETHSAGGVRSYRAGIRPARVPYRPLTLLSNETLSVRK
jgi:uncharacterized membrane protein YidH (DUF202 family)